jgi:hypothetical protein
MPLSGSPAVRNFRYTRQLSAAERHRLIFYGETVEPVGTKLCIKFVRRYSKDVHLFCAANGYAPALYGFEELPGDWYMVVMEDIDPYIYRPYDDIRGTFSEPQRQHLRHEFLRCIRILHNAEMVHGDIRDTNLLVRAGMATTVSNSILFLLAYVSHSLQLFVDGCIYSKENIQRVKFAYGQGHMVASHTWAHKDLTTLSAEDINSEMSRVEDALDRIIGVSPPSRDLPTATITTSCARSPIVVVKNSSPGTSIRAILLDLLQLRARRLTINSRKCILRLF